MVCMEVSERTKAGGGRKSSEWGFSSFEFILISYSDYLLAAHQVCFSCLCAWSSHLTSVVAHRLPSVVWQRDWGP